MNAKVEHLSTSDRRARGKEAGNRTPPSSHAGWEPAAGRPDPVALLEEQNTTREPDLVPVRHGRMMVSPFTFYRGAAKIMAADLKDTPTAGLGAQLCGDAHLSNFGAFASPERRLMFDLNDFDETLPGPSTSPARSAASEPERGSSCSKRRTDRTMEAMSPSALGFYAESCGWTLARAHARSGDPIAISECLGDSDAFDRAVADFSKRYADQNELDYQEFVNAIHTGRLQALQGV